MATSHPLSISRPSKLQPKQRAQTSINPISVVACGVTEAPAKAAKPRTSLVKSLRRSKSKLMKLDTIPIPKLAVPSVPSTPTKKRARKDTLDENEASGDAGGRLPRVRQRLVSTSSVATIRPHKSIEDVKGFEESSATCSRLSTESRKASDEPLKARPFSEINHAPGDTPQRRLRRVGTIEFPTMRGSDGDSFDSCKQSSRIPVPTRRKSTLRDDGPSNPDDARSSKYAPCQSRVSSSYAVAAAPGPAPRASLDRFELRVAPVKEHTELWDLPDETLHAWPGILILTDHEASVRFPPIHSVEVECATHAYEGRFSTESNALPVFSTRFLGATFSKKELAVQAQAQALKMFDPSRGIIMQEDWSDAQVRKNQWYIKFWVPVPVSLFRKKETRMFRLRASVCAVDDRMWKKVSVYSGTVVADISHLRRHRDMDGAAARA